jgi:hypothetical protein
MDTVDLFLLLSKFHSCNDVESETAFFKTHVPWVAPLAYLNEIFKPLPFSITNAAARNLNIPHDLINFFRCYNGAILLSGSISIDGINRPGQLLDRDNPFLGLPFNIEVENQSWPSHNPERFFPFGGYGWDGSRICIDRTDNKVHMFRRRGNVLDTCSEMHWPGFNEWLTSEIARLSFLFDESGKRLVDQSKTVPRRGRTM